MADFKAQDAKYLKVFLTPLRECAKYKPKFGKAGKKGVSLEGFREMYQQDPLYQWVGLDSDLMYAAHKAAGGMTSVYRQLGVGCERLLRTVIQDELSLTKEQVAWSYQYEKSGQTNTEEDEESDEDEGEGDDDSGDDEVGAAVGGGVKLGRHILDARIDVGYLDKAANQRVREWIARVGKRLALSAERIGALRGMVMEIRQGYKSADSKRQNADLRFNTRAYNDNYLPVLCIVSTQASETVCLRYRNAQLLVLLGVLGDDDESTFGFYKNVVGYDLAGFFERNSTDLRTEIGAILIGLLSPG